MGRTQIGEAPEPPGGELGQEAALVGNRLVEDHVEGGESIGRHQEQPVVADRVGLAHLAAVDQGQPLDRRGGERHGRSSVAPSGGSP